MTPDDLPEVIELWTRTEGVGLNESDSVPALTIFLARNPGLSCVVRDGAKIVGAVLCGHDGRRGFLYHLAVAAEYRGRGLGTALVEQCLAGLAELSIQKCNARSTTTMPWDSASGAGASSTHVKIWDSGKRR
jgi:ribosomal protein S18 acetylase RimI-like enzyme